MYLPIIIFNITIGYKSYEDIIGLDILAKEGIRGNVRGNQLTSPSKPFQVVDVGINVSRIRNRLIKEEDVVTVYRDGDDFIYQLRSNEYVCEKKSVVLGFTLSQQMMCQIGCVPLLTGQGGTTLSQEINQNLVRMTEADECCQFATPSKKIHKQKEDRSNKKNKRGGRGSKK